MIRKEEMDVVSKKIYQKIDKIPLSQLHIGRHNLNDTDEIWMIVAPHMNRNVFYSGFAYFLRQLTSTYNLSRKQQIQLLIPVGFMNSCQFYVEILSHWIDNGIPKQNMAIAFFEVLQRSHNNINNQKYPRILPLPKNITWKDTDFDTVTELLIHELDIAEEKNTTQKIIDRISKSIPYLTRERANNILQVAVLSGVVKNTYHNIANHCTHSTGVNHYFKSLNVIGNQKVEMMIKNLPNVIGLPGQRIESILDNIGNCGYDYYDMIHKSMDLYNVTTESKLIVVAKQD